MKKVRVMVATAVFMGTLISIGVSDLNRAFANASRCTCRWSDRGPYGIKVDGYCAIDNCYVRID